MGATIADDSSTWSDDHLRLAAILIPWPIVRRSRHHRIDDCRGNAGRVDQEHRCWSSAWVPEAMRDAGPNMNGAVGRERDSVVALRNGQRPLENITALNVDWMRVEWRALVEGRQREGDDGVAIVCVLGRSQYPTRHWHWPWLARSR